MGWRDDDLHLRLYRERVEKALESAKRLEEEFSSIHEHTQRIVSEADKFSPRREQFDNIAFKAENALRQLSYFRHLKV